MAAGLGWGWCVPRGFQPPRAGLLPALPLLVQGGEFCRPLMSPCHKIGSSTTAERQRETGRKRDVLATSLSPTGRSAVALLFLIGGRRIW